MKILWAYSGGLCAFPDCNEELIIRKTNDILGNICHIVAKNSNGPRGNNNISSDVLNSYPNLILLCPNHHSIVDSAPKKYTVEILMEMKLSHERKIQGVLKNGQNWDINIDQFYYLNIPRISILTINSGFYIENEWIGEVEYLHDLGFKLTTVMSQYKEVIKELKLKALKLENLNLDNNNLEGMILEFNGSFRTKNVPRLDKLNEFKMTGDIKKDPIIYKKLNEYKIVLTIDPRWLLTSTSFVNFRNSWGTFAGVFMIKQVIKKSKTIIGTPFFIGTPRNEFMEMFYKYINNFAQQ